MNKVKSNLLMLTVGFVAGVFVTNVGHKVAEKDMTKKDYMNDYDLVFQLKKEAEEVLSKLNDLVKEYGAASVADLKDLSGVTSTLTNNNLGWTDLKNASIIKTRDGYLLKLPKAITLE